MPFPVGLRLKTSGVVALPGYFIADTPWAGVKTHTNWSTPSQDGGYLSGGRRAVDVAGANNAFASDHYLATGTFKVALIYSTATYNGIHNITGLSGTQTIDGYASTGTANNYSEVTGIAVTAGVKTVTDTLATKNASSTDYQGQVNTLAIVRTGA